MTFTQFRNGASWIFGPRYGSGLTILVGLLCLALTGGLAQGQIATSTRVGNAIIFNAWNAPYCEMFGIIGTPGHLEATVYNTLGLNDCPPDKWNALTAEAIARQLHALAGYKNGRRFWVVNRLTIYVKGQMSAETVDFGGIKARYAGVLELPPGINPQQRGAGAYRPTTVNRDTQFEYAAGEPIFVLDDPQAHPWIMQAYSQIVDPRLSLKDLYGLGQRLHLAGGWKYRVKTLDKGLIVHPVNETARIVQDELENTYDQCFDTACSFVP